jgi:methylated-DNA-[protein]-cysteine S-methyltransferase
VEEVSMTMEATLETTNEAATAESAGSAGSAEDVSSAGDPLRRHAVVPTAMGDLTLVAAGGALVGVYFPEHRPEPDRAHFGEPAELADDGVLSTAAEQLTAYVGGKRATFDLPLQASGSERARQVWELIAAVPRGETTTYAALGRAVGVGPRAAGQFVARNPLCVVIPCHRVIASDGRLTGYAGGVDRKRQLLELEGALTAAAPDPDPDPDPISDPSPTPVAPEVGG